MIMKTAVYLTACWLAGTLLAAVAIGRAKGTDPRKAGSGNPGARNAGRLFGRAAFLSVFLADAAKGAIAVLAGRLLGLPEVLGAAGGLMAVIGHIFPLSGRTGGKGVSTFIGAALFFSPSAMAGFIAGAAAAWLPARNAVLAMPGAFAAWTLALLFTGQLGDAWPLLLSASLVLLRHREDFRTAITR
ncbi:glycerol-3-phosphate acyltransferase [Edaphobacillus lindanitolerans]|uniref:Glycerol-3-phosphate acyltransferase PlsY n=1 Tax=Edaphobacillus lindanitolerans TaxID=550447 RepID=A0A1U7PMI7_9BACI|nr:glycerol-3-phosphate acyltransferase [Edaphobacillus lindanitolerans]SIT70298.1 glycerol-3-phosphate acyltransferase PlsY [Edaphobacillus lindanitolerans]